MLPGRSPLASGHCSNQRQLTKLHTLESAEDTERKIQAMFLGAPGSELRVCDLGM